MVLPRLEREADVSNDRTHASLQPWRRPNMLWWGYFALYIVLFCVTFLNFIAEGHFQSFGGTLLSAALLVFDALCLAGLYAYIRSVALFAPPFWRIMLALLSVRILVGGGLLAFSLWPWEAGPEQYVALAGLFSILLTVPMLIALWAYAFKSPYIWSNSDSRIRAVR